MSDWLLAVDVGNSRIKVALFAESCQSGSRSGLPTVLEAIAFRTTEPAPWPQVRQWMQARKAPEPKSVIAGANPAGIQHLLQSWPAEWPPPRPINNPDGFPLQVDLAEPAKVGIDRLLNAVAVNVIRPAGRPAILIDTGTATTVDRVDSGGRFQGGTILPGFELAARCLHHYTAFLPEIPIDELAAEVPEPLGRDTRRALRSGLFWGQLGAVKELVARLSEPLEESPFLALTGGGASLLAPYLPQARWQPHLALQGLALVAEHWLPEGQDRG